jgi:hypothetical protein
MTGKQPMPDIDPAKMVQRTEDQVSSDLDGETVLMSIQNGKYYGMDSIGSRIWALIEEPRQIQDLCDILAREYEVDPEQCKRDVFAFLEKLSTTNLVRFSDATVD